MRVQSNVATVLDRARRYAATAPEAVAAALQPEHWLTRLRQEAERTLLALAQPEERSFIPDFVRSVSAVLFEGALVVRVDPPRYASVTVQQRLPGQDGQFDALEVPDAELAQFEQDVREWVAREKRWKAERDGPKVTPNIFQKADWLQHILLAPELTGAEQAARDKLLPHVLAFLQGRQAHGLLAAETLDLWLRAVLMQWTATVVRETPERVRAVLRARLKRK